MRTVLNRDLVAGLALVGFGIAGLALGADYEMGSATEMGAGYMPRLLAGGIVILGVVVAAKSLIVGRFASPLPSLPWRPPLAVLAGIVAFGLLINHGGLIPAVFATVLAGKLASDELSWTAAALLAVAVSAFSAVVFVGLLGIEMPILPF